MLVVYLDGVDGTGKTTLADHLTTHPQLHPHIHQVPPLWRYLPSVPTPDAFAGWITNAPVTDVATELLAGQQQRIAAIGAHPPGPHTVVLVDRGPKTVEASAHAHLHTRRPNPPDNTLEHGRAAMRAAATQLAATVGCLSIELATDTTIAERLADHERRDANYLAYHRAFVQCFQTTDPVAGVHRLPLAATDAAVHNAAAAAAMIHALLQPS